MQKRFGAGLIIAILMLMVLLVLIAATEAKAETEARWVLCRPGDWVNARRKPSTRSESLGRLECGDRIWTDGKERHGFLHVVNLSMEESEGWVYAGYVVDGPSDGEGTMQVTVQASGRVALQKCRDGERRGWAKSGNTLTVYAFGGGWAVTNRGWIRTEYLEGV